MKKLLHLAPLGSTGGWRGRIRTLSLLLVALVTMFTATVAFGQAAQDFDLACRSQMNGGGGIAASANFGVIATIGQPIAPQAETSPFPTYTARSANYGLRAGYLPGYPAQGALTGNAAGLDQQYVSRLPVLFKFVELIRGGC